MCVFGVRVCVFHIYVYLWSKGLWVESHDADNNYVNSSYKKNNPRDFFFLGGGGRINMNHAMHAEF